MDARGDSSVAMDVSSSPSNPNVSSDLVGDVSKCRPWSRADFLARLATFKTSSWFNKPKELSAAQCSKHGWVNDGVDLLHCKICDAFVSCNILPSLGSQAESEVVRKLCVQLNDGHEVLCPWRDNATADNVDSIPMQTPAEIVQAVQARKTTLSNLVRVPRLHSQLLQQLGMNVTGVSRDDIMLLMAACGWSAHDLNSSSKDSNIPVESAMLTCEYCQRRLGLWNYNLLGDTIPKTCKKRKNREDIQDNITTGAGPLTSAAKRSHTSSSSSSSSLPPILAPPPQPPAHKPTSVQRASFLSIQFPAALGDTIPDMGFTFGVPSSTANIGNISRSQSSSLPATNASSEELEEWDEMSLHPVLAHSSFCCWIALVPVVGSPLPDTQGTVLQNAIRCNNNNNNNNDDNNNDDNIVYPGWYSAYHLAKHPSIINTAPAHSTSQPSSSRENTTALLNRIQAQWKKITG